ncbi:MAG TPA: DUF2550 domain-containing protein [Pseudonocardia sp.]|jgi:hypothetical protein|nr:DUF2550 domain-containing protein [Pseudonocardia sp.]
MGISEIVGLALLLGCVALAWLAVRRLRLIRRGGVDVTLRRVRASAPNSTRGWNLGVGRYRGDEFVWYRVISLGVGANVALNRLHLEITDRRRPGPTEEYVMPADSTVLRCRDGELTVEFAMTPDVLTGFLSWLEATPPGRYGNYRQAS